MSLIQFAEGYGVIHLITTLIIGLLLLASIHLNIKKPEYNYGKTREVIAYLLTVVGMLGILYTYGVGFNSLFISLLTPIFISILFIDLKLYIIPNRLNALLTALGVVYLLCNLAFWQNILLGGVILVVVFSVLFIFSGGNLGLGDVKMSFPMGLFLGKGLILTFLFSSFLSAAIISIALLLLKVLKKDDKIAFGPYMVVGFFYSLLF